MSGATLEIDGVVVRFGGRAVLDGVSLTVAAGEVVALVGANGAGKTTLLRACAGALRPARGRVVIDGVELGLRPREAQARLGYLAEGAPAYAELRAVEQLAYRAALKGVARSRVDVVARACGLGEVLATRVEQLSHGMRRRLGLADALLGDPPLLLLDEPSSGLDPAARAELLPGLLWAAPGRAVLFTTHHVDEAAAVGARVVCLEGGHLRAEGLR